MPSLPTPGDVHVNRPLTNVAIAFEQDEAMFVADRAFATVPVAKQSDLYFTWDKGDFHRDSMREVGPSGEAPVDALRVATEGYACKVYKWAKDVSDQERTNQDSPINLDRTAARMGAQKAMIRKERVFSTRFFQAGVWDTDLAGVAGVPGAGQFRQWDDAASTPIQDIRGQMTAIHLSTGFRPNVLVVNQQVWDVIEDHPQFLERYENTNDAILTPALVARVLGLDEILIMGGVYNTANEKATPVNAFIGGAHALLAFRTRTPSIDTPSAGYMFRWTGLVGSQNSGMRVKRFRIERNESDRVETQIAFDPKATATSLAAFFENAVST